MQKLKTLFTEQIEITGKEMFYLPLTTFILWVLGKLVKAGRGFGEIKGKFPLQTNCLR